MSQEDVVLVSLQLVGYLLAHYYFLDPEKHGCKRL